MEFMMIDYKEKNKQLKVSLKLLTNELKKTTLQLQHEKTSARNVASLLIMQQEEEKKEISRELHDEIAQVLTGVNFELSALEKDAQNKTEHFKK
jgi:signal transduction histidine kinase